MLLLNSAPHILSGFADAAILGGGVIGLSVALESYARGMSVCVVDAAAATGGATRAAAGMLAANDPHNPPALRGLAQASARLYPEYLLRLSQMSGQRVSFQTETTVQYLEGGSRVRLAEHSLDPRELAQALVAAVRAAAAAEPGRMRLLEHTLVESVAEGASGVRLNVHDAPPLNVRYLVHAQGAWAFGMTTPRKGQMLRVQLPPELAGLRDVHRRADMYIVPRTHGTQAGSALLGATVEDAGFDLATYPADLDALRERAAELLPALASPDAAPCLEAWAGLRPSTPDGLPLLGAVTPRQIVATGHYRNGILLAPATAVEVAELIEGRAPGADLFPFFPGRFGCGLPIFGGSA